MPSHTKGQNLVFLRLSGLCSTTSFYNEINRNGGYPAFGDWTVKVWLVGVEDMVMQPARNVIVEARSVTRW